MASRTFARRLAQVVSIPQQDSAERAFNKSTRTFAAQMSALEQYRSKGEQKMTVQHVRVAEGGQAIVGNVNATPEGVGRACTGLCTRQLRRHATSKRSGKPCRSPSARGHSVCRMHGAGGGGPKGNKNALKHGLYTAEGIETRRMVGRQSRELVETIG
jgi:hypothetical protein